MSENKTRTINVRVTEATALRLEAAADRDGVSRSAWVTEALDWALDTNEAAMLHVPKVVEDSLLRRNGSRLIMPAGRIMPTRQR